MTKDILQINKCMMDCFKWYKKNSKMKKFTIKNYLSNI